MDISGGVIGKMFAQQNIPGLYNRQRKGDPEESAVNSLPEAVDRVELSSFAPRPLDAPYVEEAEKVGRELAGTGVLSGENAVRLREDRVFAAVSTLMALGITEKKYPLNWPGGLPRPTSDEMSAAYRRLTQRLSKLNEASDPTNVDASRRATLDNWRGVDFRLTPDIAAEARRA